MSQFIEIFEHALSDELCQQLIKMHEDSNRRKPGCTGSGVDLSLKDSTDVAMINNPECQDLLQQLVSSTQICMREYLKKHPLAVVSGVCPTVPHPETGEATAVNSENFETVGLPYIDELTGYLFRYGGFTTQSYEQNKGGYHYWHSEIYPQGTANEPLHREIALLYYLNDVEEGGETEFHYQQITAKPKAGTLVIFPAGFTHAHKGHVAISSDKFVITAWFMFNRAEQLYGAQP